MTERACNCDPADNGGGWEHHHWCDTYRPAGMSIDAWYAALATHPIFGTNPVIK